jgi:hypothetical protein
MTDVATMTFVVRERPAAGVTSVISVGNHFSLEKLAPENA